MPATDSIEREKLEIERARLDAEIRKFNTQHNLDEKSFEAENNRELRKLDIQAKEVAQKDVELELKAEEANKTAWSSPLVLALIAAVVGIFGNGVVALINGANEQEIETIKTQGELVLEAIKSDDVEKNKQNLLLLAGAKLIDDEEKADAIILYVESLFKGVGPGLDANGGSENRQTGGCAGSANVNVNYSESKIPKEQRILAVGDSWFNLPALFFSETIIDCLEINTRIVNNAMWGTEIDQLSSKSITDMHAAKKLDYVLVSIGGSEILKKWSRELCNARQELVILFIEKITTNRSTR